MDKWKKYGSFNSWKNSNYEYLLNEYKNCKNCGDSMRSTDHSLITWFEVRFLDGRKKKQFLFSY